MSCFYYGQMRWTIIEQGHNTLTYVYKLNMTVDDDSNKP